MDFTEAQLNRYARHIILPEVGGTGQARLMGSKVLVIGAGGLGSPVLMYLAAAGVGTLGIVDDDRVDLSNLQRQVIHATSRVGAAKVESARRTLAEINPEVRVVVHCQRLTAENAPALIRASDLVVDGSDNFATRYLANDACYLARRPLVSAAMLRFDGQISTFKAYLGGDHVTAIHLLVPQIEHALRLLLRHLGKSTSTTRDEETWRQMTLNVVLQQPELVKVLGPDLSFYMRVLLSEDLGWNVRDAVCHGLWEDRRFGRAVVDRLLHVIVALSMPEVVKRRGNPDNEVV